MKGHGEKLSRKREQAIVALIDHPTIPEAAKHCGVSESTLRRWMAEPSFKADLEDARKTIFDRAIELLRAGTIKAAQTLIEKCDSSNDSDAIRAARAVVELYTRAVQLHELDERLKAIEQKQNAHETLNAMHRRVA